MTKLNPELSYADMMAWQDILRQAGLLAGGAQSGQGPQETAAYNPGGRGKPVASPISNLASQVEQQYGVSPIVEGNTENGGGWGMFWTQLVPAFASMAAGSGVLGDAFRALSGGAEAAGAGGGAAAAGGAAGGVGAAAPAAGEILVTGAPGLGLGGAMGAGGAVASALGGQGANPNEIQVTGRKDPTFDLMDAGGVEGLLRNTDLAPRLGEPTRVADTGGLKPGGDVLQRILSGVLGHRGVSGGGMSAAPDGAPAATSTASPVMASASPFAGAGAGAGSPAGLAIKGSTAPDIFPWTSA